MQERTAIIFLTDVDGTISQINEESAMKLQELIDTKRKQYNADVAVISFVTNEPGTDYLEYYPSIIKEFIETYTIALGDCYTRDAALIDGEIMMMFDYGADKTERLYECISKVREAAIPKYICYAEDFMSQNYKKIILSIADEETDTEVFDIASNSDTKLQPSEMHVVTDFKTKKRNIEGVIECFEKSIEQKGTPGFSDANRRAKSYRNYNRMPGLF